MSSQWTSVWQVPSTSRRGTFYTVGLNVKGFYGCSCPAWKFQTGDYTQRKDCKHIRGVKANLYQPIDENILTVDDLKWIL